MDGQLVLKYNSIVKYRNNAMLNFEVFKGYQRLLCNYYFCCVFLNVAIKIQFNLKIPPGWK